jgi:hypothetical protein
MANNNPMSPGASAGSDLRGLRRQRVFKGAKIVFNGYHSVLDCTVRDLTETGARLRLSSTADVPQQFELYFPQEKLIARARLAWQMGRDCGIALAEPLHSAPALRRI